MLVIDDETWRCPLCRTACNAEIDPEDSIFNAWGLPKEEDGGEWRMRGSRNWVGRITDDDRDDVVNATCTTLAVCNICHHVFPAKYIFTGDSRLLVSAPKPPIDPSVIRPGLSIPLVEIMTHGPAKRCSACDRLIPIREEEIFVRIDCMGDEELIYLHRDCDDDCAAPDDYLCDGCGRSVDRDVIIVSSYEGTSYCPRCYLGGPERQPGRRLEHGVTVMDTMPTTEVMKKYGYYPYGVDSIEPGHLVIKERLPAYMGELDLDKWNPELPYVAAWIRSQGCEVEVGAGFLWIKKLGWFQNSRTLVLQ